MPTFDPSMQLPERLQQRLDSWHTQPPKHQFQAYGPLNAYLQAHKFKSDRFLVKPQKLLRLLAYTAEELEEMQAVQPEAEKGDVPRVAYEHVAAPLLADYEMAEDHAEEEEHKRQGKERKETNILMDVDGDFNIDVGNTSVESNTYSVDSAGRRVLPKRYYPDFEIDQYFGPDTDENPKADIARVILEIGSEGADRAKVYQQLAGYLQVVDVLRIDREVLGIAMIGNKVRLASASPDKNNKLEIVTLCGGRWISMFDEKVIKALDKVLALSNEIDPR